MQKNRESTAYEMDLAPVLADCLGHMDMLEDLLAMYKDNINEFCNSMDRHLVNSDTEGIVFATHKIKCSLKMMRTESLVILTDNMHQTAQTGAALDGIARLYHRFKLEYPEIEIQLEGALKRLKQEKPPCKE